MGTLLKEMGGFRKRGPRFRIALVYPNVYEIGMANLGFHTVYSIFNGYDGVACERFFLGMNTSIETNSPLSCFDVIAFSLQYELDYINFINILVDNGIEPVVNKRTGPMVIAGGPCCFNPLPLSKFVDLFIIGDFEPIADYLVEGIMDGRPPEDIAESGEGLFSPGLMKPTRTQKADDMDSIPAPINQPRPVSPGISPALGSTFMVEISRGCNIRCRFCMYSHCTFPKRERSFSRIREIIEEGLRVTDSRKVSLIGALVTDHSEIKAILGYLAEKDISVSLPSIRTDMVDREMLKLIGELGIRTLTIAPEGSPHTRGLLKKGLDEEKLRSVVKEAPEYGVKRLRMYFITGVPGQSEEDFFYIPDLCSESAKSFRGRNAVTASINPLVPRPHTPAEFVPMAGKRQLKSEYDLIRKNLPSRVNLKLQSIRHAHLQAYIALGGIQTGDVILEASKYSAGSVQWKKIADARGDPMDRILKAPESKPWHIIETGISRKYHRGQAYKMMRNAT